MPFLPAPAKKRSITVISTILCRKTAIRLLFALALSTMILVQSGICQDAEDSKVFISGFNAYQQKDYATAIKQMNDVLQKYPDTPLRDMTLFWLARAYFKSGNQQDAARYMAQFTKEYPDNPLKGTVEEELLVLAANYDKKTSTPSGSSQVVMAQNQVEAQKASAAAIEQKRVASIKAEEERAKAEQIRLAAEKAEKDRLAAVESARLVAEKAAEAKVAAAAEQKKQALIKAEEERVKAEQARLAAVKAEKERLAARKAEQERLAALKVKEEKIAAEKAAEAKLVAAAAEQKKQALIKAEEERVKAEQARLAAVKAEKERLAARKVEQERLAALKVKEEKIAAEKAAEAKLVAAAAEQKRQALIKAEAERVKAEQARLAAVKVEKERLAALKAEQERLAALKVKEEKIAAEKVAEAKLVAAAAEQKKQALIKAEAERVKAEQARLAAVKVEKERLAVRKAEQERLAALKVKEEKIAAEARLVAAAAEQKKQAFVKADAERVKAEQERLAAAKLKEEMIAAEHAAEAKLVEAAVEQKKQALLKAEEDRAKAEQTRLASLEKAKEEQLAQQRRSEEQARTEKSLMRDKAIAQYKSVIEKYPDTKSASLAAAKLKELGIVVAPTLVKSLPQQQLEQSDNTQVLKIEVAQFSSFDLNVLSAPTSYDVASRISLPFELTNRGNGADSFYLESGFPVEFNVTFSSNAAPEQAVNQTPSLAPGETFKGLVNLAIPANAIDGLRINYPIKAASRFMGETSLSREIRMTALAPLLRSVLKSDKTELLPGEKIVYRIALLNLGSSTAKNVTLRLDFPPQLEPLDHTSAGFKQEMKAALVLEGLEVKSGENREFTLTFQLKDDALAGQELLARAELINNQLKTHAAFVSNVASVKPLHNIRVGYGSDRLVVIPGETVTVPFVVTNTGNVRDNYKITSRIAGTLDAIIFQDLNRDGIRQATEPLISSVGPLEPKEEVRVGIEIKTSRSATDGADGNVGVIFVSDGNPERSASAAARLIYSRPVLQMVVTGHNARLKPGEIASFEMNVTNRGSNLARVVELQSSWPEQLELVAAEPINSASAGKNYVWKFNELGAGEKRTIKVSFRVKQGIGVGSNLQVKNIMTYEDQLGNRY